jgi:hypothetical protein
VAFSAQDLRQALKALDSLRYGAGDLRSATRRIVEVTHDLFAVDGATLMLIDGDLVLRNVEASDDRLADLEDLEVRHGTGPCITAYQTKEVVSSDDLAADTRWEQSEERGEVTSQLERALRTRTLVEQAKGVLVQRDGISSREAFERIRADARQSRRKVADVADDVLREAGAQSSTEF